MKIWHNPRCGKSREALAILGKSGTEVEVIEYLKTPPSKKELLSVIKLLKIEPLDLIRKGERMYKETYKGKNFTNDQWIEVMVSNPILIERPIVISSKSAVIGRPPSLVLELV